MSSQALRAYMSLTNKVEYQLTCLRKAKQNLDGRQQIVLNGKLELKYCDCWQVMTYFVPVYQYVFASANLLTYLFLVHIHELIYCR